MTELLRLDGLTVRHNADGRLLLDDIKITVKTHRTLALVGESGSGKSLLAKSLLGLLPGDLHRTGTIYWRGQPITDFHRLRGRHIGLIVQNAMNAFDPLMPIGRQFAETVRAHRALNRKQARQLAEQALADVQLTPPDQFLARYPNQLSGGQLQRIMLALTLALEPALIIADEPTTALDSLTQHQLVPLLRRIPQQTEGGLIFITHDIALAGLLADDIAVLRQGRLIEFQSKTDLFRAPQQAYPRYLLAVSEKLNRHFHHMIQGGNDVVAGE